VLSFLHYRIPVASNSSVRCLHPKTLGRVRRARTEVHPCKAASLYLVDFEVGLSFREQQRLTMLSHRDPIVRWARASGDGAGAQDAEITPPILDVPSTRVPAPILRQPNVLQAYPWAATHSGVKRGLRDKCFACGRAGMRQRGDPHRQNDGLRLGCCCFNL